MSFVELYDAASQVVRLGGRRRGANMAVLGAGHADIEAFVAAKAEPGRLATFNLSVAVGDELMPATVEAVQETFWQAWRAGVKGITAYRSGSRPGQILRVPDPDDGGRQGVEVHGTYVGGSLAGTRW